MMNRERMSRVRTMRRGGTTLGLDERVERVLAYLFVWVSGLILFVVERRNRNVRWHAAQSMLTFGPLFLIMGIAGFIKGLLGGIFIIGLFIGGALGLLIWVLWIGIAILWIWLLLMALLRPNYRLPFVSTWADMLV